MGQTSICQCDNNMNSPKYAKKYKNQKLKSQFYQQQSENMHDLQHYLPSTIESQKQAFKNLNLNNIKEAYQSIDDYNELEHSTSKSFILVNTNNTPANSFQQQQIFKNTNKNNNCQLLQMQQQQKVSFDKTQSTLHSSQQLSQQSPSSPTKRKFKTSTLLNADQTLNQNDNINNNNNGIFVETSSHCQKEGNKSTRIDMIGLEFSIIHQAESHFLEEENNQDCSQLQSPDKPFNYKTSEDIFQ